MINSAHKFETLVVDVLDTIKSDDDLSKLEETYKSTDINEALGFCIENKFVLGFHVMRVASGKLIVERQQYTFVTYDGLKFIEAFKGEETSVLVKKANKKSQIAIIISVISIFLAIARFILDYI